MGPDEGLYFLFLEDSENKESAILRSNEYQLLQSIKIAMEDSKKLLANIGRPLAVQIHDSTHTSILSSDSNSIEFRGLVNLLVLILLTYTFRAVIDSLDKHNFVLFKEISDFLRSGILEEPENYQTFAAFLILTVFPVISFWIEIAAANCVPK